MLVSKHSTTVNKLLPKKAAALTLVIVKAMQQNWAYSGLLRKSLGIAAPIPLAASVLVTLIPSIRQRTSLQMRSYQAVTAITWWS